MAGHGEHVLIDFSGIKGEREHVASTAYKILEQACDAAGVHVVHTKLVLLPQDGCNSPPGFCCVFLLDESHCTLHSYSDSGEVAADVFTCSKEHGLAARVADTIMQNLLAQFPGGRVEFRKSVQRFQ